MKLLRAEKLTVIFSIVQLLNVCVPIDGRYVVEVKLFGYNNPTQRCQFCPKMFESFPGCCDSEDVLFCQINDRCDSYFTYCLRTISKVVVLFGCLNSPTRTSTTNLNDAALDFSQSVVLGLENPLQLQRLPAEAYNGVQLYSEIRDRDVISGTLVDAVAVNHTLAVNQTSQRRNHTGFYGLVTMDLTITVLCAQNFQGADCTECTPGFTGPNCDEVDNCFQVTCSGNGQCVDGGNSFTCSCNPGFTGDHCQTNINDCVEVNCSGNGQCVDGTNSYTCFCDPGFTGESCQTDINDCVGVNCSGNGQCVDGTDSFKCSCDPGFTGDVCHISVTTNGIEQESGVPTSDSRISAGALGGSIAAGTLILLIPVLILTVVCVYKMLSHREPRQSDRLNEERQQDDADHQMTLNDLKAKEVCDGTTVHCIKNEDDVVYDKIKIKDHEATPHIATEGNVAYGQATLHITNEDQLVRGEATPYLAFQPKTKNIGCDQIYENS